MAHKEYNSLAGARLECWLYILAKFGAVIFVHFLLNPPKKNTLTARRDQLCPRELTFFPLWA